MTWIQSLMPCGETRSVERSRHLLFPQHSRRPTMRFVAQQRLFPVITAEPLHYVLVHKPTAIVAVEGLQLERKALFDSLQARRLICQYSEPSDVSLRIEK